MTTDDRHAATLSLGPDLTIGHAAAWRETLLTTVGDGRGELVLDLSSVTDVDSSGIQLLLAARRLMAERGGSLQVTALSSAVRDALVIFGLADLLAAPQPMTTP